MFNLEQAIANWRRDMLAEGISAPVPLDELEAHLREEIEEQIHAGLDEPAAFASAVSRLGQGHTLQIEFAHADPAQNTFLPKLAGGFYNFLLNLDGLPFVRLPRFHFFAGFLLAALNLTFVVCTWFLNDPVYQNASAISGIIVLLISTAVFLAARLAATRNSKTKLPVLPPQTTLEVKRPTTGKVPPLFLLLFGLAYFFLAFYEPHFTVAARFYYSGVGLLNLFGIALPYNHPRQAVRQA